jgi:hypothetical protein
MNVAFAALAGADIELQVRIGRSSVCNVLNGTFWQRCAAQIGVQDHARSVDHRAQRILDQCPQLSIYRISDAVDCQGHGVGIELTITNLVANASEHRTRRLRHGGVTLARNQFLQFRRAQQLVDSRQAAEKLGLVTGFH